MGSLGSQERCFSTSPGKRQFLGEAKQVWAAQVVFTGLFQLVLGREGKGKAEGHLPGG